MIDIPGTLRRGWQQLIAHIDFPLLLITLTIMAVGLATVYSATFDGNERIFSQIGNMALPWSSCGSLPACHRRN